MSHEKWQERPFHALQPHVTRQHAIDKVIHFELKVKHHSIGATTKYLNTQLENAGLLLSAWRAVLEHIENSGRT